MTEKTVKYAKPRSLQKLSDAVGRDEGKYGPLKNLDRTETSTIAVFEQGLAPMPAVEILVGMGEPPVVPSGYDLVCAGPGWVLTASATLIAVRKSA